MGKGSSPRPVADPETFRGEYERIFSAEKTAREDCPDYRDDGLVCIRGRGHEGNCGGHTASCATLGFDCGCPGQIPKRRAHPEHIRAIIDRMRRNIAERKDDSGLTGDGGDATL